MTSSPTSDVQSMPAADVHILLQSVHLIVDKFIIGWRLTCGIIVCCSPSGLAYTAQLIRGGGLMRLVRPLATGVYSTLWGSLLQAHSYVNHKHKVNL